MKKIITLLTLFITIGTYAQDITGPWHGLLTFPGGKLRITVNIAGESGNYTATLDSPDQGAAGIPADAVTFKDKTLSFTLPSLGADYKGTYKDNRFTGTFTQKNYPIALNLGREEIKEDKPARPQEPVKPYPYKSKEVIFTNSKDNTILAGTLTMPEKGGNFPAVILVSGSGPQNRDEELLGHKPFLVLANHLTRNGIAVLRYDDRGTAASKGTFEGATTNDFAGDAAAAFTFLQSQPDINNKKVGIIGHSEGGTIAPIVAAENSDVAFIVLMAGTAIPGDEIMMLQNYLIGKANGMPEEELTKLGTINRKVYTIIKEEKDEQELKSKLRKAFNSDLKPLFVSKGIPADQVTQYIDMQVAELTSPWYSNFIRYNPATALEKVECPILAINGENDLQVAPVANLDAVKRIAEKSGNKKVTTKQLPGLNHLFQESKTGAPSEYGTIEQTIAPAALDEILSWINKQVK